MFPIRQIVSSVRRVAPGFRAMSSSGPPTGLEVDNEGIATLTMQRPPVNSLNLELLQNLNKAFDEVAKNKCKGLILTSVSQHQTPYFICKWKDSSTNSKLS